MDNPLVSILIPTYNRKDLVLESLESAVNQTYKNIEVIVVDNNSTDGTFEVLKKFAALHSNVKVYKNEENIGPVRNWQRCLDYATGEYVKILWSDDLIAPTFIEKTLPYLMENENVGFSFTNTEVFDETGKVILLYFDKNKSTEILDTKKYLKDMLLGWNLPVSPGCALFRRRDVEKNLVIDIPGKLGVGSKMHGVGSDLLVLLLTAKDYPKIVFVGEVLSFFRAHQSSITVLFKTTKMYFLYFVAKTFFVENYINDPKLIKEFSRNLLSFLIKEKLVVKKLWGFYCDKSKVRIDYVFLCKASVGKFFKKRL
jgi:glycosyltransferase involved in cell wall biosynthesis